jgi:hypothetical protein
MTSDDAPEPDAVVEEKLEDNALWDYYRLASKQDLEEEQELWSAETIQQQLRPTIEKMKDQIINDTVMTNEEDWGDADHPLAEEVERLEEVFSSE